MDEVKRLTDARKARRANNADEAKNLYALVYAEDPECAEAKFYYRYYNLKGCAQKEVFDNFYELCKVVGPVLKTVAESDWPASAKELLVADIFNSVRDLPVIVNRRLNDLNKSTPDGKYVTVIKDAARMGIQMLYNFGDTVERYMYPDIKLIKTGVRAWETGVYRHWQWYSVGLDKKFADRYTSKIRKYLNLCRLCEEQGVSELPARAEGDYVMTAGFDYTELYNPANRVVRDDTLDIPVNEDGYSWKEGNYSILSEEELKVAAERNREGGQEENYVWNGETYVVGEATEPAEENAEEVAEEGEEAPAYADTESDNEEEGANLVSETPDTENGEEEPVSVASSFGDNNEEDDNRPAWGNSSFGNNNDDEDDDRPAWGNSTFGNNNDDEDDNRPAWGNSSFGNNNDDEDRPAWGASSFGNNNDDEDRPAWGASTFGNNNDDEDDRPAWGNSTFGNNNDDEDDSRPAWGNSSFGINNDEDVRPAWNNDTANRRAEEETEYDWDAFDKNPDKPVLDNEIAKITDKIVLACPVCQKKILDNCGRCTGITLTCPRCGTRIQMDVNERGEMRLLINAKDSKTVTDEDNSDDRFGNNNFGNNGFGNNFGNFR